MVPVKRARLGENFCIRLGQKEEISAREKGIWILNRQVYFVENFKKFGSKLECHVVIPKNLKFLDRKDSSRKQNIQIFTDESYQNHTAVGIFKTQIKTPTK